MNKVVSEFNAFEKCTGIVTDEAKSMVGSKTGLVVNLKEFGVKCACLQCIIHKEALFCKVTKMNKAMKVVVNIVNLIHRGNKARGHRAFITFLEEMDADYCDIPLHSDIRWLNAGKCLQPFLFALRKEILLFLQTENLKQEFQRELQGLRFTPSLAFLADLTSHLNILNLKLLGKRQNISHLVGHSKDSAKIEFI
jgi:hypothetical protein